MNTDKLQKRIAEMQKSNAKIAKEVGITEAYMSQIINGLRSPNVLVAKAIAEALDCKIDDLL